MRARDGDRENYFKDIISLQIGNILREKHSTLHTCMLRVLHVVIFIVLSHFIFLDINQHGDIVSLPGILIFIHNSRIVIISRSCRKISY